MPSPRNTASAEMPSPIPPPTVGKTVPGVAVLKAVRKYWATAAAVLALIMAGTVFYTLGQKRIFQARATIMFDPNPPRPLGHAVENVVDIGSGSFWHNQEYYETQYYIIRSRGVATEVVRDLGLANDQRFLQNTPPDEEPEAGEPVPVEAAAEAVRARVAVLPIRDSRLARVTFVDADPERARRILSALVNTYVAMNLDRTIESTGSATDWLRGQLDSLKRDLESSEHALHEYKKNNDILSVAFDDKSSMLVDQMRLLNQEVAQAESELGRASARHSQLNSSPGTDPTRIESSVLLASPMLATLRSDYQAAVKEHQSLLGGRRGRLHPEVVEARARVTATKKAVLREIRNIKRAARRDVREVSGHVGGLRGSLEEAKKQAHELNLLEIEYNDLRRTKENTEKLYSLVLERTKESDLTQMMRVNNISVVDEPLTPGAPIQPRVPLNITIGLFLGLLAGIGAAFGRSMLDRSIKVPDDVEAELGLTCLGLLPQMNDAARGPLYGKRRFRQKQSKESSTRELIVHHEPMSSVAEAARSIRTNLMFMSPDKPPEVMLITSSGPMEGKTTVACCIATAMAQAGQRVVLVDCDLRRPRIHRVFKFSNEEGVASALLSERFHDAPLETPVPNLVVVPAGPIPPNPAELLHTKRFARFLDAMREEFDRVIVDSPPVAAVTDPTILSTLADATILVVRAFKTRRELAKHAARALGSVTDNVAGVVLNDVNFDRSEYRYSQYYYYRRDGYASEPEGDGTPRSGVSQDAPPPTPPPPA